MLGEQVFDISSGLGIGTSPSALIAHGIATTIVEIDPVVHQYASRYFHLPQNHISVIRDAVSYVKELQGAAKDRGKYDYIIHDVFTGGAEPIELFTKEFLEGLSYLLNAEGVIAIVSLVRFQRPMTRYLIQPELRRRSTARVCVACCAYSSVGVPQMPPVSRGAGTGR